MPPFHHADPAADALAYHGGRLDAAARRFPAAPTPWIDLSTGISPFPWPIERMSAPDLRVLPPPGTLAALCRTAARRFGAAHLPLAALPGSEIGLRLLGTIDPPRPWRVVAPAYRTHGAALPGATPIAAAALDAEAAKGGTILLANPNNPDGTLHAPATLLAVARRLAARGGLLVVDEAFADAVPGAGLLPLLDAGTRVLVFRSFGKFFGLAGVRLGFVGGAADAVAALAERLGSWPISATALACGTAAYADDGWIAAAHAQLADAAAAVDGVLARHGLIPQGACPLFRLVETDRAAALFERLGGQGVLVRPFDYAPHWLRIGLPGDAAAMARLDAALGHR